MATTSVVGSSTSAAGCGKHATAESASLVSGHRLPRDVILLAVRYYLQLGAAAERIAGGLAHAGVRSYVRACRVAGIVNQLGQRVEPASKGGRHRPGLRSTDRPHANIEEWPANR